MGHIKVIDTWTNEDGNLYQSVMYYLDDPHKPFVDDRLTHLVSRVYFDEDNEVIAMINQHGDYIYGKDDKNGNSEEM